MYVCRSFPTIDRLAEYLNKHNIERNDIIAVTEHSVNPIQINYDLLYEKKEDEEDDK